LTSIHAETLPFYFFEIAHELRTAGTLPRLMRIPVAPQRAVAAFDSSKIEEASKPWRSYAQ
jgi:hypothetical protein